MCEIRLGCQRPATKRVSMTQPFMPVLVEGLDACAECAAETGPWDRGVAL